jgi:predicted nucleotidyltransferase
VRGERRKLDSLALLPASAHGDAERCRAALVEGGAALLEHIIAQDLGALWHQSLWADGCWEGLPLRVREELHAARRSAAANYLAQRNALKHIDQLFETQGISYVVIKGAHIREYVYPDPALRPASDIDILIAPADRRRVARTLLDAGYRVYVSRKSSATRPPSPVAPSTSTSTGTF